MVSFFSAIEMCHVGVNEPWLPSVIIESFCIIGASSFHIELPHIGHFPIAIIATPR